MPRRRKSLFHRPADPLYASGAAHLGHETSARFEGVSRLRSPRRPFHPVQGRVAEDGVEFVVEIERLAILHAGIESAFSGGLDLLGARIDADNFAAHVGQLSRERTVAAAKIEDAFARLRIQQLDHSDPRSATKRALLA